MSQCKKPAVWFVVLSWVAVCAWAGFIFFMSSNTGSGLNEGLGVLSRIYQVLKGEQRPFASAGAR